MCLWVCCSVQGYGQKAPGIGAFVYPGSGATCDTRPASAGAAAPPSVTQPNDLPTTEEVSCSCLADVSTQSNICPELKPSPLHFYPESYVSP